MGPPSQQIGYNFAIKFHKNRGLHHPRHIGVVQAIHTNFISRVKLVYEVVCFPPVSKYKFK